MAKILQDFDKNYLLPTAIKILKISTDLVIIEQSRICSVPQNLNSGCDMYIDVI